MFTARGVEVSINEDQSQSEGQGEIAALDNGNFAVAFWQQSASGNPEILVRIVDNNGQPFLSPNPIGHDILVSDSAGSGSGGNNNNYIDQPVIAPVAGGGFIVAWTERVFHTTDGVTYSTLEVRAQTYNSAGLPVGELIQIENASDPHISVSHAGHVLVYSTTIEGDDSAPDDNLQDDVAAIMALSIGTNGSQLGTTEIARAHPDSTGDGRFGVFNVEATAAVGVGHAIAWQAQENFTFDPDTMEGHFDIVSYVQAFTGFGPVGQPLKLPFDVEDIAATGNGNFVAVGVYNDPESGSLEIVGEIISGVDGQPMGSPFVINTSTEGDQYAPAVTTLGGDGGFVVVWHDSWNGAVGAQEFDAIGQALDSEFPVSLDVADDFAYDYSSPDVAADPFGGLMVTWTGWDDDGLGVRAQTFSPAVPAAFFTGADETVDFNHLTAEQQQAVDDAASSGGLDSVYDADEGNDNVILPDLANAQITPNVEWDYSRTFYGRAGNDHIQGGDGNDIIAGGDGADVLDGNAGNDVLRGGTGNDTLHGGEGADVLAEASTDAGPFGDDLYDGGAGNDRVNYFISNGGGVTVDLNVTTAQNTGQGNDALISIEHVTATYGNDTLTGNDAANWFWTFSGNDTLTGNGGNDYFTVGDGTKVVSGGAGVDTLEIAEFAYVPLYTSDGITVSLARQGTAQAVGTGNWTISGIENLGGFNGDDELTGDANDNVLAGHLGADTLVGGAGNDQLFGDGTWILDANGNQYLVQDDSGDGGPGGNDLLDGGAGDDYLFGGDGEDTASYGSARAGVTVDLGITVAQNTVAAGNDTLIGMENLTGSAFADILRGSSTANRLTGGYGDDTLYGNGGNDALDGGVGSDKLIGGAGNDTYIVRDATDFVYENAGEGTDNVLASVSASLRANVENLTLTGTAGISGKGNELGNAITGNSGANALYGYAGNDSLVGGGGRDILDGGAGNDTLTGGSDNDVYVIDSSSDVIVENAGEGIDFVQTSASYTLSANVERMYLLGTASINGTGNDLANLLVGNSGANALSGMGANDRFYGGGGNDRIDGGEGNDYMEGGTGQDDLIGGAGKDYFVFRDGDFGGATAATADRIEDFALGDRISLSPVDANTGLGGNQAFAFIGTGAFDGTAGELRYEQTGGNTYLSGDTNGDGIADFMIKLDGLHTLTTSDLLL